MLKWCLGGSLKRNKPWMVSGGGNLEGNKVYMMFGRVNQGKIRLG